MTYAIIAVGYNRPLEMKRLLDSLCQAQIGDIEVDLIISLDKSDKQEDLKKICEEIQWDHGEKIIRPFSERQGLRNHILQCGDLTDRYDAVIVLEDDLVVAKGFMQYVVAATDKYHSCTEIAGISLYTHRTNPGNGRFFEAQYNGFDAFMMQYAQSWGQCWTKEMWTGFRAWYKKQGETLCADEKYPEYVAGWNKQSWLKYYIKYTVETRKFHIYPYFSLTTNSSAVGEHNNVVSSAYQVPLQYGIVKDYRLPDVDEAVKYDAFFERIFDKDPWGGQYGRVVYDLYGLRKNYGNADTVVSVNKLPFKIYAEIGLLYRPIEQNILTPEVGRGIYVYDIHRASPVPKVSSTSILADYEFRAQSGRMTLQHGINKLKQKIRNRVKRK